VQLADAEEQLQQAVRDKLQIQLELSQAQVGPKGGGVRVFECAWACGRAYGMHVGVSLVCVCVRAVHVGACGSCVGGHGIRCVGAWGMPPQKGAYIREEGCCVAPVRPLWSGR
jgi:hypothetical protein